MIEAERQPVSPKPRRRWFRYSLRTLLLLVLLASIGMNWVTAKMRRGQRTTAAVEMIERAGGLAGSNWWSSRSSAPAPAWMRQLLGDHFCGDVVCVVLSGPEVNDHSLEPLAVFPRLQELGLSATSVTDAGLDRVAQLTDLHWLSLHGTEVTDTGLERLGGLQQLRTLILGGTRLTDSGLKQLQGFSQLRELHVSGPEITDEGITQLQQSLPNCNVNP